MRSGSRFISVVALLVAASLPRSGAAAEPAAASPASESTVPLRSPRPGWLPGGAALIPGLVVHGSGVWVAGEKDTAYKLLAAEGIGLGMMAAGALPLILTDASGQNIDLTVALLVAGAGLFLTSGIADLYGATIGGREGARSPLRLPHLEPFAGYAFVYNPQFGQRHFTVLRLDARVGRVRVTPEAWLAVNTDERRVGGDLAVRFVGPRPDATAADGSFVDLQIGAAHHRFGRDGFDVLTTTFSFPMRLDLRRVGPSLAGSFVDFEPGWGFLLFDYGLPGRGLGTDISGMLLMRFGYGLYFGGSSSPRGEVAVYYDHRHDGFAGGLALDLHDPNFFGHVGLVGKANLGQGWGLRTDLQVGSSLVAMLGVLHHWGGPR